VHLRIKVKAYATIRDALGASVEIGLHEGATVKDLLNELTRIYGKFLGESPEPSSGLPPYVKVLVNGRDIDFLKGLETKLKDGDEVALFPPVGGG
jgi:molybdopterin synthase sulfur carrier subunit